MEPVVSMTDVHQLYKQWQDGKLLDNDERQALRLLLDPSAQSADSASFAKVLKSASDSASA